MQILGIIPARSGSKGIKNKNIRLLNNKPLLYYAIEGSKNSLLDRVILSTNSKEIMEIANNFGVETPFLRPDALATDLSSSFDVIIHCLKFLEKKENYFPDAVFLLRPTSPFRTAKQIDEAIYLIENRNVDSVSAMGSVKQHPFFMFYNNSDGKMVEYDNTENKPERRQDLPEFWEANCHTMLSKTNYLYRENKRQGKNIINFNNFVPYFIDHPSTLDIDTEEDFLFAEFLFSNNHNLT